MNKILLIHFLLFSLNCIAQDQRELFGKLQAISNNGIDYFNVDGINITSQTLNGDFSKKNIVKKYKRFSINEEDLNQSDANIKNNNYYILKSDELAPGLVQHTSYYFIETAFGPKAITFGSVNKNDRELERSLVNLIGSNDTPPQLFERLSIDSINFVGKKNCTWQEL